MVIEELIKELQQYPSQMRVLVDGYESGHDNIDSIYTVQVYDNGPDPWYEGQYQTYNAENQPNSFDALVITR